MGLAGRSVVVTGASGNLGRAVCARLAAGGARVVPFVHTKRAPEEIEVELTDPRSVQAAFEGIALPFGVVNCAGGWKGGAKVANAGVEVLDEMLALNLKSAFLVSGEALRRGAKRIVNVASFTAAQLSGMAGSAAYNAAKAAVVALTKAIAEEGAADGVRCSCVAPGTLRTKENERGMPRADPSRWVPLEQVAEVIAFLLDPASEAVNGAVITLPSR
jgi:NAD(P)-dependent dehydrogenase (short-subunit alcohol dehydrogenase family)